MERLTFMNGDGVWCVDNENCFEEQSEHYCGPAIDRLAYYEDMEEQGRIFISPCAMGERWRDTHGEVFTVAGFHCDKWAGWSILYHYEDDEGCACNPIYFKAHYTREEAEQALKGGVE